ncbi:helicase HerA-like domain-containing protein [Mesorhizobium sp. M0207]|uniref:helicase HerA-like domain-containing protein n=1 Tax=Mesorhizobium sp. M0207 TaxID=2956915 RepID=UPI003336EE4E
MSRIDIGRTAAGAIVALPLRLANRHGLVTGATGTGKTVTLQRLAEQFSAAGVPVFAADIKGDLSGVATAAPVAFWDIFGRHGLPVRTSVQDMGAGLLARMLGLNQAQEGAMEIVFRKSEDEQSYMLTLDDLRWSLNDMIEEREDVCRKYGNVTAASIAAIQRNLLALEAQGGDRLFGEPPFDILDLMAIDAEGGNINLLHADQLLEAPKLYATFLLWLLSELFRKLPEAGDLPKPKLVFFFDEAHLLFADAPKHLLQKIERLVRLVRSKGVGVFFVTQSPTDVPAAVLEQLGTRILHAMRAHTAESLKKIKAAADTIRPRKGFKTREELPTLKIGEALISVIGEDNVPSEVEKVQVIMPAGQVGSISDEERQVVLESTPLRKKYHAGLDENAAGRAFSRRMMEARGIDPGPEGTAAPEANLYLKHVPSIDISAEPGKGAKRRLFEIAAWGAVAAIGLKMAGVL